MSRQKYPEKKGGDVKQAIICFLLIASGCTSRYVVERNGVYGGSYSSTVDNGVFHTGSTATTTVGTAEDVERCASGYESHADRVLRRQAIMGLLASRMGTPQWMAIVPPDWGHPSQWTDGFVLCVGLAMGMDPRAAVEMSQPTRSPTVVQNPWAAYGYGSGYGYPGTGAPGVR